MAWWARQRAQLSGVAVLLMWRAGAVVWAWLVACAPLGAEEAVTAGGPLGEPTGEPLAIGEVLPVGVAFPPQVAIPMMTSTMKAMTAMLTLCCFLHWRSF